MQTVKIGRTYFEISEDEAAWVPDIRDWMAVNRSDYEDRDGLNLTRIAEDCANELQHPEWLDDEQHVVWEIAFELLEQHGG